MKTVKNILFLAFVFLLVTITSCGDDDKPKIVEPEVVAPSTYAFERDGVSTVSFDGQTTRIAMSEEIVSSLKDETLSEANIDALFDHQEGVSGFDNADLNASGKSVKSKVAASTDFFSANTTDATAIKADFDGWIASQVEEVFPNWSTDAIAGTAGAIQQAGGGSIRYVNANGLEYNQAFAKSLIGGLMVDQVLNHYIGAAVLDAEDNIANNDSKTNEEGKSYTTMEHKWDEGYGYVYGAATNTANPNLTIGDDDSFLSKYIGRVDGDIDFAGIADAIFDAFKLGRAAIVAGNYTVRDEQAAIVKDKISMVIAVRAVFYLQQGKVALEEVSPDMAAVFHELSEGYGFVYSLQFTRKSMETSPYFTRTQVLGFLTDLMDDGANGLWDVTPATLDAISDEIASEFGFTVAQAAN